MFSKPKVDDEWEVSPIIMLLSEGPREGWVEKRNQQQVLLCVELLQQAKQKEL